MRRALPALGALALVGALAPGLFRLHADNGAERFFPRGDPALDLYEEVRTAFPLGDPVRILVYGPGLWSADGLVWLRELEEALGEVEGVVHAVGPLLTLEFLGIDLPLSDPDAVRALLRREPLVTRSGAMATDGESLVVTAVLDGERAKALGTLDGVERRLAPRPDGVEVAVWGLPVLDRAFDREVTRTLAVLMPASALVMGGLLWAGFGSLAAALPSLLTVLVAEVGVLGGLGWSGARLDVVTSLIAPLLLVIGVPTTVHLQVHFRRALREGHPPGEAASRSTRDRRWAVLWAGLTTALAFGSLATSPVRPVSTLGIQAALGIGALTALSLTLFPFLLSLGRWGTGPRPGVGERASASAGRALARWAVGHRRGVQAALGVSVIALALALAGLEVESDLSTYLPAGHPVEGALRRFEGAGMGAAAAEVVVRRTDEESASFLDPAELLRLEDLARRVRADPAVSAALGAGDLFGAWTSAFVPGGGDSREGRWLALGLLTSAPRAEEALGALVRPDLARVTALVPFQGLRGGLPLLDRLEAAAREAGFEGAGVTGAYPLVLRSQASLFRTLVSSLTLTLLLVGIAWGIALRGRSALVALVPNLWAVLVVLAALALAGIPVEAPSVMTASVVLGLAVDDTFHAFGHLRAHGAAEGVPVIFERLAPGHLISSVVLVAGFLVMAAAPMAPIAHFGALVAVGATAALVGDLVLLPALLGGRA